MKKGKDIKGKIALKGNVLIQFFLQSVSLKYIQENMYSISSILTLKLSFQNKRITCSSQNYVWVITVVCCVHLLVTLYC